MENKTDSDASKYIYNPLGMGIASIVSCALFMWGTYSRITFLMFFIFWAFTLFSLLSCPGLCPLITLPSFSLSSFTHLLLSSLHLFL